MWWGHHQNADKVLKWWFIQFSIREDHHQVALCWTALFNQKWISEFGMKKNFLCHHSWKRPSTLCSIACPLSWRKYIICVKITDYAGYSLWTLHFLVFMTTPILWLCCVEVKMSAELMINLSVFLSATLYEMIKLIKCLLNLFSFSIYHAHCLGQTHLIIFNWMKP